jgi:hypothetical protein
MNTILEGLTFKPRIVSNPLSWVGHIPFAATLVREIKPKLIVELGTHTGNSYFTFCQAVQENKYSALCYAVDTWQGEAHAGLYDESIFQKVDSYNKENYADFSYLLRTTFDAAAKQFSDNSIDLLHIDGLHTYEAVKSDYETWLPKVRNGGIILFHDICCRHDDFGVWKLWEEIKARNKYTHEFTHSYGLGVLMKSDLVPTNDFISRLTDLDNKVAWQKLYSWLGDKIIGAQSMVNLKTIIGDRDGELIQLKTIIAEREATITQLQMTIELNKAEANRLRNLYKWSLHSFWMVVRRMICRKPDC